MTWLLWKWLRSCASPALSTRWTESLLFLMEALRGCMYSRVLATFDVIVLMVMCTPFRLIFRWYPQQQAISYSNASPYQSCTVVNRQMVNHARQLNISSSQGSGISKSKADNSRSSFGFRLNDIRSICSVSGLGGGILKFLQRGGGGNYSTPLRTRCMVRRSSNQKSIELGPSLTAPSADLVSFSTLLGSCKRLAAHRDHLLGDLSAKFKKEQVFFSWVPQFWNWLACMAVAQSREGMPRFPTLCKKVQWSKQPITKQPINPFLFNRSFKLQNTSYSPRYKLQRRGQNNPN